MSAENEECTLNVVINFRGVDITRLDHIIFPAPKNKKELGFIAMKSGDDEYLLFRVMPQSEYDYGKKVLAVSKSEIFHDGYIEDKSTATRLPICYIDTESSTESEIRNLVNRFQKF